MNNNIVAQIEALQAKGDLVAALRLTENLIGAGNRVEPVLFFHATLLKALQRMDEALAANRRYVERHPHSPFAWHNLAATLADLDRPEDAVAAADKALGCGPPAPETLFVKAKACAKLGRFDDAIAAYEAALKGRPNYADALQDLSQLIWMQTGDIRRAERPFIDRVRYRDTHVATRLARLYFATGHPEDAYRAAHPFARAEAPADLLYEFIKAALAVGHTGEALSVAQFLHQREPANLAAIDALFYALSAVGKTADLIELARHRQTLAPSDQMSVALLATACRRNDDPEYKTLYDYDAFVRTYKIPVPKGWHDLDSYLADLSAELIEAHKFSAPPTVHAIRNGSQTHVDLRQLTSPAIKSFFEVIQPSISDYLQQVGSGSDPLRRRNQNRFKAHSAWSVRLGKGGHHPDHIHPQGWLSAAFYVEVPPECDDDQTKRGWLRFGQPNIPGAEDLLAEHWVKPAAGLFVLFPSYMWHGTVPIEGDARRLAIAVDIVP